MRILPVISSNHNEWFKATMRLHQASVRREDHKFLIEGSHLIEEAIATQWPLESICFEESWADQNQSLLQRILQDANRPQLIVQPATRELLRRLSTTATRTPVIGVAYEKKINEIDKRPISLALAIESLQDPGNLGSMIRIAAAGGVSHVFLSDDSVAPTNPKVLRATAGQWFRNPPIVTDLREFLRTQKAASLQILAASADGRSFWETDLSRPTILLLGNEGNGLSTEMRALATDSISVPMVPGVESLNVSITASLLVYEALRQRSRLG
jgi:RNA methyltransferase, TrmH family